MLKWIIPCWFLLHAGSEIFAQHEATNWAFSNGSGLTFATSPPGQIQTNIAANEGCAAISDSNGNLLLYTNGLTLWNNEHQIIEDLAGGPSARQSSLIVPSPVNSEHYYVFAVDEEENSGDRGLTYSIVDINANNGAGQAIVHNISLHAPSNENITSAGFCNNNLIWVVAGQREFGPGNEVFNSTLRAYRIDIFGIDTQPVSTTIDNTVRIARFLKFSPQGDQIAFMRLIDTGEWIVSIAPFDHITGRIGAYEDIFDTGTGIEGEFWSFEFSPGGEVLYITQNNVTPNPTSTYKVDLTLNDGELIRQSAVLLDNIIIGPYGNPQLSIDGRIYAPVRQRAALAVISTPDDFENSSFDEIINLDNSPDGPAFGLPNFITSYFDPEFPGLDIESVRGTAQFEVCRKEEIRLGPDTSTGYSYTWQPTDFLDNPLSANPVFLFDGEVEGAMVTLIYEVLIQTGECMIREEIEIVVLNSSDFDIAGSPNVCPNVEDVSYQIIDPIASDSFEWFLNGGNFSEINGTSVEIDWGPTNSNALVKAVSVNQPGCPSDTVRFPVQIKRELEPSKPVGQDSVCYNFSDNVAYQTSVTNGSVYTWFNNGDGMITGQGKPNVTIDWSKLGHFDLWVEEFSETRTDVCLGVSDTLEVVIFQDSAAITLNFASVDLEDESRVELSFKASLIERISDLLIISRKRFGETIWEEIARVEADVESFLDQNIFTDLEVYEYKIEGFNKCDEALSSTIHNTIKLDGLMDQDRFEMTLFWNNNAGWDETDRYEIWRKLDGEELELIDVTEGDINDYISNRGEEGFVHQIRIRAKEKQANNFAWSNEIELVFDHDPVIPNVITPNGDGLNDFFRIGKIELFAQNQLAVFNRSGKNVMQTNNYANEWSPNDLPPDTYYYTFRIDRDGRIFRGWLQILK